METRPEFLFIYGTLLNVAQHPIGDLLRDNGRLEGKGSIQARLFMVTEIDGEGRNQYPAAIPSAIEQHRVHGEVWRILNPQTVFPVFDEYEACSPNWQEPHEFLLRTVPVKMDSGDLIHAGAYLYAWDTSRATPVPSGRYETVSPDVR